MLVVKCAVFTFGREDLIPDMFIEIVRNIKKQFPEALGLFTYYLERHIEIDGDIHGALSERMVTELCGEDEAAWTQAAESSQKALRHRIELWTSVIERHEGTIQSKAEPTSNAVPSATPLTASWRRYLMSPILYN